LSSTAARLHGSNQNTPACHLERDSASLAIVAGIVLRADTAVVAEIFCFTALSSRAAQRRLNNSPPMRTRAPLIARLPEPVGCTKSSMTASASSSASWVTAPRSGSVAANFTDRFSTIAEAVGGLSMGRALIDGEAVVLRNDGRTQPSQVGRDADA
jgi:hypothetical protein